MQNVRINDPTHCEIEETVLFTTAFQDFQNNTDWAKESTIERAHLKRQSLLMFPTLDKMSEHLHPCNSPKHSTHIFKFYCKLSKKNLFFMFFHLIANSLFMCLKLH